MSNYRPKREGVMLCTPLEDKHIEKATYSYACFQPKLRGDRCRVAWYYGEPYLISSYGNEFQYMSHIRTAISHFYGMFQIKLDGELYVHGWSQERIHSACSRKVKMNPDTALLEYHVYDIQDPNMSQEERIRFLDNLFSHVPSTYPIKLTKTIFGSIDLWQTYAQGFLEAGYEGLIWRSPYNIYTESRAKDVFKFKPTEPDEYIIIGFKEGTGWATGMLGSFLVTDREGNQFYCGTGRALTKEKRALYWKIRDTLLGKTLVVKHEPIKTSGGVPVCISVQGLKEELSS